MNRRSADQAWDINSSRSCILSRKIGTMKTRSWRWVSVAFMAGKLTNPPSGAWSVCWFPCHSGRFRGVFCACGAKLFQSVCLNSASQSRNSTPTWQCGQTATVLRSRHPPRTMRPAFDSSNARSWEGHTPLEWTSICRICTSSRDRNRGDDAQRARRNSTAPRTKSTPEREWQGMFSASES